MDKSSSRLISVLLYTTFVVSTIITLFIVYRDIDNLFSSKFVISYVVFLILYFIYFIITTAINMGKLKWFDIRKRIYRFITSFVFLSGTSIICYYFLEPTEIDYYRIFPITFGTSLGVVFFDLAFLGRK